MGDRFSKFAQWATFLLCAFAVGTCCGQEISGPDRIKRDHMGTFSVTGLPAGSTAFWLVFPTLAADQWHVDATGPSMVGPVGKYNVVLFGATKDNKASFQKMKTVEIYSDDPTPPVPIPPTPPGPTPPGPLPPNPPGPNPPTPTPPLTDLAKKVSSWVALVKGDPSIVKPEAGKLANNFFDLQSQVAAGTLADPKKLFADLRTKNNAVLSADRQQAWKPWSDAFAAEASAMIKSGKLTGKDAWSAALADVGNGLKAASL